MSDSIALSRGRGVNMPFIRSLIQQESNALGFLADEALEWYAENGLVLGCAVGTDATGFALGKLGSPTYPDACSLYMTAVRPDARRHHHATSLLTAVTSASYGRQLSRIQLWCRGDLASNEMWAATGMTAVAVRAGGTGRGLPHVCWMKQLDATPVSADRLSTRRRGRGGVPLGIAPGVTTADVLDVIRRRPADLLTLAMPARLRPIPPQLMLFTPPAPAGNVFTG